MQNPIINPAIQSTTPDHMSSQEFQQMLYTWFEEKGLVSDLRSYLRTLMIKRLRNTPIGRLEPKANFSLSKQAFSLLIAEHLLREGCHYTLSIFSTEVPGVTNHLPLSLFEAQKKDETWRFDQESVVNLLELIGISKNSSESLRVSGLYFRNAGSLLSCLISAKTVEKVESEKKIEGDVANYVKKILVDLGVGASLPDEVKHKIEEALADQKKKAKTQQEKLFNKMIEKLKQQLEEKDQQLKSVINEQMALKRNCKKIKCELKEAQKRLNQTLLQEETIKLKEAQLREKMDEISQLGKRFKDGFQAKTCQLKHCGQACDSNVNFKQKLEDKISEIQHAEQEKTREIERLNSRLSCLVKELQSSQLKIEFLNSCLLRSSQLNLPQGEGLENLSEDSSDTTTSDVIKQVRTRLAQLEHESEQLDLKFKKLSIK